MCPMGEHRCDTSCPYQRSFAVLIASLLLWELSECKYSRSYSTVVSVQPKNFSKETNCFPFGAHRYGYPSSYISFDPYIGYVYKNVHAFHLQRGDLIAFDMVSENDHNIVLDIAVAPTTENGGPRNNGTFRTIVRSGMAFSKGDSSRGTFDLKFEVNANDFRFDGGGMILRFRARGSFINDSTCTPSVATTNSQDPSGHFVLRFQRDLDGVAPWLDNVDNSTNCAQLERPEQDCEFNRFIIPFSILQAEKKDLIWINYRPRNRTIPEGNAVNRTVARLRSKVSNYDFQVLCNLATDGPFILHRKRILVTKSLDYETSPKGGYKVNVRCRDGENPPLPRLDNEFDVVFHVSNIREYPRKIILSPLPVDSKVIFNRQSRVLGIHHEEMELPEDLAPAQPIMNITVLGQDPDLNVDLRISGEDSYLFEIINQQLYLRQQLDGDFHFVYVTISATANGQGVNGHFRGKVLRADDCHTRALLCGKNAECKRYSPTRTVCRCKDGFEQDYNGDCWPIDYCKSIPCGQHGICNNTDKGFHCYCEGAWYGKWCEHLGDLCKSGRLCQNGGSCHTDANKGESFCICYHGYSGSECQTPPTQPTTQPMTQPRPLPTKTIVRTTTIKTASITEQVEKTASPSILLQYGFFIAGFGGGILLILLLLLLIVARHRHLVRAEEKRKNAQNSSQGQPELRVIYNAEPRRNSKTNNKHRTATKPERWQAIAQSLVSAQRIPVIQPS